IGLAGGPSPVQRQPQVAAAAAQVPPPATGKARAVPAVKQELVHRGRVVGADGQPLPEAEVVLVGLKEPAPTGEPYRLEVQAHSKTDRDGRFELRWPGVSTERFAALYVLGSARGHGLRWVSPASNAAQDLELRLPREHVLRGRLTDLQGVSAARARARVAYVKQQINFGSQAVVAERDRARAAVHAQLMAVMALRSQP